MLLYLLKLSLLGPVLTSKVILAIFKSSVRLTYKSHFIGISFKITGINNIIVGLQIEEQRPKACDDHRRSFTGPQRTRNRSEKTALLHLKHFYFNHSSYLAVFLKSAVNFCNQ